MSQHKDGLLFHTKKDLTHARVEKGKVYITIKEVDAYKSSVEYTIPFTAEEIFSLTVKKTMKRLGLQ